MGFFYTLFIRGGLLLFALLFFVNLSAFSQCSVTIRKVTVSGCYSVSGTSKATVSVEVGWVNAPANEVIIVTTGAQSRTITPGAITVNYGNNGMATPTGSQTIVSPQVVAFELTTVSSTTANSSVTARFSNSTSCSATQSYIIPPSCNPIVCQTGGFGGMVFNDYDADGVLDSGETNGVAGITVRAYACDNTLYQATTDAFGKWSISGTINYPVRVEFSNIPSAFLGTSTVYGSSSRTTVQFIDAARCDVDLGVTDPLDYCQNDPLIVTPCYVSGDPLVAGSASTSDALVGFPYNSSGTGGPKTFMISAATVGTTWAQAYSKFTKRLFSAATIKRHAGLGPGGLDAIYITNLATPSSPVSLSYIKVGNLGINVGTFINNAARGLVADKTQPSNDPESFTAIGKIGIGGMSMSSDGETLYLMNISNNSLYALDLSTYNTTLNPNSITLKGGPYAVPSLSCASGQQRSWAVKYNKGKVYVGTICDASSGTRSDLRAGVFAFDPATNTFTTQPVFDFPLTYSKGFPDNGDRDVTGWYPWTDNFSNIFTTATNTNPTRLNIARPTPMLSDIEFDIDGSLVLAFNDRTGLQTGFLNYGTSGTDLYSGHIGGDILRAFFRNGSFVLENAAKAGPTTGYAPVNNQGPGFGEFYNDDSGVNLIDDLYHSENGLGALALRPGSGEVVSGAMDPTGVNTAYDFTPFSGGVRRMNNTTGLVNDAYVVYQTATGGDQPRSGTFGKAAGLGDLELTCDLIQYIQIGNRVWVDTDKDGIQDACEKGLPNVRVSLYRSGTLVSSTTTNATGEYYFSFSAVQPNTVYQLVFGTNGQFSGSTLTVDNGKYGITLANSTSATANDLNDSDAQLATVAGISAPVISLTTGGFGEVNHTFDVGFVCLTTTVANLSITPATCNATTTLNNASISLTGLVNADKIAIYPASQTTPPAYTAINNLTVVSGAASFTGLTNPAAATGTAYQIIIFNGPCCSTVISATLPQGTCACALALSVTPGTCDPVTNRYTVSGVINLTNTPASSLTVSDGSIRTVVSVSLGQSSATFSLTGLSSGSGTHTITVLSSATLCGSVSRTYAAPASCTVPAVVSVNSQTVCAGSTASLTATGCTGTLLWSGPGGFSSTSNVLSVATSSTLTTTTVLSYTVRCTTVSNSVTAIGRVAVEPLPTVTIMASSLSVTQGSNVTLTAVGCENGSFIWSVPGNTARIAVVEATTISNTYSVTCITQPNCQTTASITISGAPINLLIFTDNGVICAGQSVTLSAIGCDAQLRWSTGATTISVVVNPTVTTEYSVTCTNGSIVEVATGLVQVPPIASLTLTASSLTPTEGSSVTLLASGCESGTVVWSTGETTPSIVVSPTASSGYSATCTTGINCRFVTSINLTVQLLPRLSLEKYVSKQRATIGEVISYTVVLSNTGKGRATNVIVRDSISSGLAVVPGSVTVSQGFYSPGVPVSLWTLASLPANTTATLVFSASVTMDGVVYNTATIPGDTNTVCTSIPIRVCKDSDYAIEASAPAGHRRYQWLRRVGTAPEVIVYDGVLNSYSATQPGEYRVIVDEGPGTCPDLSCCPLIIEEDSVARFTLVAKSPTCAANQPQTNGSITITGLGSSPSSYSYAISEGTSFTVTNPVLIAVPTNGIVLNSLNRTKTYTVRVYNALGCFRDETIILEVNCECPETICVPVVIRKTKNRQ